MADTYEIHGIYRFSVIDSAGTSSQVCSLIPHFFVREIYFRSISIEDYLLQSYLIFIYITKPLWALSSNFTSFSQ